MDAPGAVNLIGRILYEIADNAELYEELKEDVSEILEGRFFDKIAFEVGELRSAEDCKSAAEGFLVKAAEEGYVYACNSLAAREADRIVKLSEDDKTMLDEYILNYICFLKLAADRFEPYAANRLGLFYMTGEITSGDKKKDLKNIWTDQRQRSILLRQQIIRMQMQPGDISIL